MAAYIQTVQYAWKEGVIRLLLIYILLSVLLLILLSGGYVFVKACVRTEELPWMDEEKIKKTGYAKYYNCIVASSEWLKANQAQDVYVTSKDGLRLHGYWIPAKNPRGTILLAHGYRSTILVDFGLAFAFYHALGMNILVPQQRCHGESQGKFITLGVKESEDMLSWIDYHNRTFSSYQMILSGLSMGASTVLYLANQKLPQNVKCIIADCGFTSPKAILDSVFRSVVHLPSDVSLWAANIFAKLIANFSLSEKDTRRVLKNARIPVLMIHGTADDFVPCSMTQEGFDACTAEKDLLLVEGAGHGVSFLVNKEAYTNKVIAFLEKHLDNF